MKYLQDKNQKISKIKVYILSLFLKYTASLLSLIQEIYFLISALFYSSPQIFVWWIFWLLCFSYIFFYNFIIQIPFSLNLWATYYIFLFLIFFISILFSSTILANITSFVICSDTPSRSNGSACWIIPQILFVIIFGPGAWNRFHRQLLIPHLYLEGGSYLQLWVHIFTIFLLSQSIGNSSFRMPFTWVGSIWLTEGPPNHFRTILYGLLYGLSSTSASNSIYA